MKILKKKHLRIFLFSITIIIIILALFVPKLIDWAYLHEFWTLDTTFCSKDLLGYWGMIISGLAVIVSLLATIKHEKKMREQTERNSTLPYISIRSLISGATLSIKDYYIGSADAECIGMFEFYLLNNGIGLAKKIGISLVLANETYNAQYTIAENPNNLCVLAPNEKYLLKILIRTSKVNVDSLIGNNNTCFFVVNFINIYGDLYSQRTSIKLLNMTETKKIQFEIIFVYEPKLLESKKFEMY